MRHEKGTYGATGKFCCRCKEEFPVALAPHWRMGELRHLTKAPKVIREAFSTWLEHEDGGYLCGNCYFDLTDESV